MAPMQHSLTQQLNEEQLQRMRREFLSSITVTQQQAIPLTTVNQDDSLNSTWQQSRRCCLTSSNFGRVAKCNSKYEKLHNRVHLVQTST